MAWQTLTPSGAPLRRSRVRYLLVVLLMAALGALGALWFTTHRDLVSARDELSDVRSDLVETRAKLLETTEIRDQLEPPRVA